MAAYSTGLIRVRLDSEADMAAALHQCTILKLDKEERMRDLRSPYDCPQKKTRPSLTLRLTSSKPSSSVASSATVEEDVDVDT